MTSGSATRETIFEQTSILEDLVERARRGYNVADDHLREFRSFFTEIRKRISDEAYRMWESAGREQGKAFDFWLAAQRKVLGPMIPAQIDELAESMRKTTERQHQQVVDYWRGAAENFLVPIWEDIQDAAYSMWEAGGKQQNMALDYWLAAEKQVLQSIRSAATPKKR